MILISSIGTWLVTTRSTACWFREKIGEVIDPSKICYDDKYNSDEWYTENVYDDLKAQPSTGPK